MASPDERDVCCTEFTIRGERDEISVRMLSPTPEHLCHEPGLLLTFAADRETTLNDEPYCYTARRFLAHGHRVLSFDLPNHGEQVDQHGSGIGGLRNAFVAGEDRFAEFVADGLAVVNHYVQLYKERSGRIVVGGTSRGAYFALRLLAADPRIVGGAGFAPVIDWRDLQEFAEERDSDDVAALRLPLFADSMRGKRVYLAIGNHDRRVSTASCCRFYLALVESDAGASHDDENVDLYLTDDVGHTLSEAWYRRGTDFLLELVER